MNDWPPEATLAGRRRSTGGNLHDLYDPYRFAASAPYERFLGYELHTSVTTLSLT